MAPKVSFKTIVGHLSIKYEEKKSPGQHGTSCKITAPTDKTCGNESKIYITIANPRQGLDLALYSHKIKNNNK